MIEHVTDPAAFVRALAARVSDRGQLVLSTPNRTVLSRIALITIGEGTGMIPRGTHDWQRFLTPEECCALIEATGMTVIDRRGISFSPASGLSLSDDLGLNYLVTARPAG